MANNKLKRYWKSILLLAIIAATAGWGISTWKSYHGGLDRPQRPESSSYPPLAAQTTNLRARIMNELNLSWSQQWEIAKIRATGRPQSPDEFADRLNQMQEVLLPGQRRIAAGLLEERFNHGLERRLETAQRILPDEQYDIFKDRLKRNVEDFRSRLNDANREEKPK